LPGRRPRGDRAPSVGSRGLIDGFLEAIEHRRDDSIEGSSRRPASAWQLEP